MDVSDAKGLYGVLSFNLWGGFLIKVKATGCYSLAKILTAVSLMTEDLKS